MRSQLSYFFSCKWNCNKEFFLALSDAATEVFFQLQEGSQLSFFSVVSGGATEDFFSIVSEAATEIF